MAQWFKSIYFSDHPGQTARQRNLKLAFGPSDEPLYRAMRGVSSQQIRDAIGIGSFEELQQAASASSESVNAYCLARLRTSIFHRERRAGHARAAGHASPILDPLQATFRGGKDEPLHNWYPYLEGYSPEFVQRLLDGFAPAAIHIFDPFAGTGTTPLTAARLNRQASYCELNPLLQFLIRAKVLAHMLDGRSRTDLFGELKLLAATLSEQLAPFQPDRHLATAYRRVFGESEFFDPPTFALVLTLRTWLDNLACRDSRLAVLATVAVLGSLIPASLLIRRGDVRYRTAEELRKSRLSLDEAVASRLDQIAHDLLRIAPLDGEPRLLCSDARQMAKVPSAAIDAVVTSPPYPNGTNYFRNTKVELWFLRCLNDSADLSHFRRRAVTAGINDVTVDKPAESTTAAIRRVVEALGKRAYDVRIPRMIQTYFHDLVTVFDALASHLASEAPVLVDIGDSSYGGVRVATAQLLTGLLEERGYRLAEEIVLRKRASRSGEPLTQSLLVLRGPSKPTAVKVPASDSAWSKAWVEFKTRLPHQHGEYAKRNWGHPLHSLCSYQGKMKPSLAASLVRTFVPDGGRLLDPFGGVGTIPFEAALQGRRSWCFDISPAAMQISTAKLASADRNECRTIIEQLERHLREAPAPSEDLKQASEIRFNGPLVEYFHPRTLTEIVKARRFFLARPPSTPSEALVFSSLLHILHGNRPYALSRRSHPITPFAPTGPCEYRGLIARLREKVQRGLAEPLPAGFVSGTAFFQDATETWPQEVDDLDAVLTSPPFFDSTRFHLANWMRLWFCGWNAVAFNQQPRAFVDERQKTSLDVYASIFRQARERLKPGGVFVLHLGKSRKCDMASELAQMARRWFRIADRFDECVAHCESHGIRDKGTVIEHSYLVLE
jgi:hypothetical protein